jgi:O-antigen/teichoic acid export membrane protein
LKLTTARNSIIMAGSSMALRPIGIISNILLARILLPADFGAVALAMLFVKSSTLFVELGMGAAVIHSDLKRQEVAFHAFIISTVSSVTISIFTLANSAWLATLLGDPDIEPILQALTIQLVLTAWTITPSALLRKDLMFGAIARSNLLAKITYVVVTLVLALFGLGVWSLVIGSLAEAFVAMVVVWWLSPSKDWLKPIPWNWDIFKSLLSYGSRSTGSGVVHFFSSNWDDWFVGRNLGTEALGFYSKAYDFTTNIMRQFGNSVIGTVFFPVYASIKENTERLKRYYLKSVRMVSIIMFPIAFGFLATASLLIPVVLGEKWIPMTETFQVFSLFILSRPLSSNAASVFSAVGKPQYNMYAGLVLSAVMVPIALLLVDYGIVGIAIAVLIAHTVAMTFNVYLANRIMPGSAKGSFGAAFPALAASLIMFVIVILAQNYIVGMIGENVWSLSASVVIGVIIYGMIIFLLQREFMIDLVRTVFQVINRQVNLERFMFRKRSA